MFVAYQSYSHVTLTLRWLYKCKSQHRYLKEVQLVYMSNELYFPEKKARHTTFLWFDAVTTFFFNCWFFVVVPAHVYTQSFPVFQDYQSTPRLPEYTQTTRIHPDYQNTPSHFQFSKTTRSIHPVISSFPRLPDACICSGVQKQQFTVHCRRVWHCVQSSANPIHLKENRLWNCGCKNHQG